MKRSSRILLIVLFTLTWMSTTLFAQKKVVYEENSFQKLRPRLELDRTRSVNRKPTSRLEMSEYPISMEWVTDVGGASKAVAVSGNYAYLHEGMRLTVFDASSQGNPQYLSNLHFGRPIDKIFADGSLLYVCTWDSALYVVDASNPASLSIIGHVPFADTLGNFEDITVVNHIAYAADIFNGLRIIDVQDPYNPVEIASYDTMARGIDVVGSTAYVVDGFRLRILNVAQPSSPQEIGTYHAMHFPLKVAVQGNYAYVLSAGASDTLHVLDVSNPGNITLASSLNFGSSADFWDLKISGTNVYIANGSEGLSVVDISDPLNPTLMGSFDTEYQALDLALLGNYVYLASMNDNLKVIDVSNPSTPTKSGVSVGPVPLAAEVLVHDNIAYIAAHEHGMRILDVTTPWNPTNFSYYYHAGIMTFDLDVSGNYAFLADYLTGLHVIDISSPSSPHLAGSLNFSGGLRDIKIRDTYAYVLDGNSKFYILNVSDPSHPSSSGSVQLPTFISEFDISEDCAFGVGNALRVIDIDNPSNPQEIGTVIPQFYVAMDIGIRNFHAWIGDFGKFYSYDIRTPATPTKVAEDTSLFVDKMFIHGDYAYTSDSWGMRVIDISDPANPILASNYDNRFWVLDDLFVQGEYLYVADYWLGLTIYHTNQPPVSADNIVSNTTDSGTGTLREAIIQANNNPGPDQILFQIPATDPNYNAGTGVWTIRPQSQLPVITDGGLTIDGSSQSDYIGSDTNPEGPEIELTGSSLSNYEHGLIIQSQGCHVNHLVINHFPLGGIYMQDAEHVRVTDCYLGTDITGMEPAPNQIGINIIYGTRFVTIAPEDSTSAGNLISGNASTGIAISDTCSHITIIGNTIGLNKSRLDTLGNGVLGIGIQQQCDSIEIVENSIGANYEGIYISGSESIWIMANMIGTNFSWEQDFGNSNEGIYLDNSATHVTISENMIGRNGRNGITVSGSGTIENTISRNGIAGNRGMGINNRNGGNLELPPPQIQTFSDAEAGGTTGPNQTVEVFADTGSQGRAFLGSAISDGSGNFTVTFSESPPFSNITATATDDAGNTSEFSAPAATGVVNSGGSVPDNYYLAQNHPNPFNPVTTIAFGVRESCRVVLRLYNILGHEIMTITDKKHTAGHYEVQFDAAPLSSGIYMYSIEMKDFRAVRKMMVLK